MIWMAQSAKEYGSQNDCNLGYSSESSGSIRNETEFEIPQKSKGRSTKI
jgi:hypothetical protein